MTSGNTEELRKDLIELKRFHEEAVRNRIKDWLSIQIRKVETELSALTTESEKNSTQSVPKPSSVTKSPAGLYTVQLTTYGFDQSDKFIKLYLTSLTGVHNIPVSNIVSNFDERSFTVKINELDGKNYELRITKLLHLIDPAASLVKLKTDCVLIMLKKKDAGKHWDCVTLQEQILKEKKKPKYNADAGGGGAGGESADPQAGLMNMMKQMYDEGDDDMKRTIAKAWTEARDKQGPGGPGSPGMPGMDMDM